MNIEFYEDDNGNVFELIDGTTNMKKIIPNTTDAAQEKHVPKVTHEDGKLKVSVGEVIHPMDDDHLITFVEQVTPNKVTRINLTPGETPVVYFDDVPCEIISYCNKHGLWKTIVE